MSWALGKGIKAGHKQWDWNVDTGECRIKLSQLPTSLKGLQEGSELVEDSVPNFLKNKFADADKEDVPVPKEVVPEPKPAGPTPPAPSSSWQTSAALGFVVPETRWGSGKTREMCNAQIMLYLERYTGHKQTNSTRLFFQVLSVNIAKKVHLLGK